MTQRAERRRGPGAMLCGAMLCGALLPLLAGCHHRQPPAPMILPQTTPVPLANEPATGPLLPEPPKPKLPEVPVAEAASKPKRIRRKSKPPVVAATAPAQAPAVAAPAVAQEMHPATEAGAAANADPREEATIGALTVGGEQDSKTKQDAAGLIAANERRLSALSADVARAQGTLVAKVRTFQRDAQQALVSGDVEGARTLATKGKLLLDDLEKSGS